MFFSRISAEKKPQKGLLKIQRNFLLTAVFDFSHSCIVFFFAALFAFEGLFPPKFIHSTPSPLFQANLVAAEESMNPLSRRGFLCFAAQLSWSCWSFNIDGDLLSKRLRKIAPFFDETILREVTGNRQNRIYANATKLRQLSGPVTRELITTQEAFRATPDTVWITIPFRASVLCFSYLAFPSLIEGLRDALPGTSPNDVAAVTSGFAPAISLLYGAWLGLTFNILEERLGNLERTATIESARLCNLCERSALVASEAPSSIRESLLWCLFEQTTMLAVRSREEEIVSVANSDCIYWNYRCALRDLDAFLASNGDTHKRTETSALYEAVDELAVVRAERLSMETKSLPAAHFAILAIFSLQLLTCFVYVIVQSPVPATDPPLRVAFSAITAVYLLVFNFATDLDDPFRGNYQIRRTAINANLLAARRRIAETIGVERTAAWIREEDGVFET